MSQSLLKVTKGVVCAGSLILLSSAATADQSPCDVYLSASFIEGAPRDNFEFKNTSSGGWLISAIEVDLANSAGKLIFDTKDGGTGVEVYQAYKTEAGDATPAQITEPLDGGTQILLQFESFEPQQTFRFSVDVDDTLKQSDLGQIRVTGGELDGATLTVTFSSGDQSTSPLILTAAYDQTNKASVKNSGC